MSVKSPATVTIYISVDSFSVLCSWGNDNGLMIRAAVHQFDIKAALIGFAVTPDRQQNGFALVKFC